MQLLVGDDYFDRVQTETISHLTLLEGLQDTTGSTMFISFILFTSFLL